MMTCKMSTRDRLLNCALTIFADKGYSATGTQEIIEAAGVTKPVLYHYFKSKEALFRELVGGIYDATAVAWDEVKQREKSPISQLRDIARISFAGSGRDPRLPRLLMQTHYGPVIAGLSEFMATHTSRRFLFIHEIITAAIKKKQLRQGDPASIALYFCCIMDQHINVLSRMPNAITLLTTTRADALVDAFLQGCGTDSTARTIALPPI